MNKQIEFDEAQDKEEHEDIFTNYFHYSINCLRDYGWSAKELSKHITEHFELLDKENIHIKEDDNATRK